MEPKANDRATAMTDMAKLMNKLLLDGYSDQYKVVKGKLVSMDEKTTYKPKDIKAVNFYRFEGASDPDDMSILYAIETNDGRKGTLVDAYGVYGDEETGKFMDQVEIHKKTVTPHVDE